MCFGFFLRIRSSHGFRFAMALAILGLQLREHQAFIPATGCHQLLVRALFQDFAAIQHHNAIRMADCAQSMCDDKARPPAHEQFEALLDQRFAF